MLETFPLDNYEEVCLNGFIRKYSYEIIFVTVKNGMSLLYWQ